MSKLRRLLKELGILLGKESSDVKVVRKEGESKFDALLRANLERFDQFVRNDLEGSKQRRTDENPCSTYEASKEISADSCKLCFNDMCTSKLNNTEPSKASRSREEVANRDLNAKGVESPQTQFRCSNNLTYLHRIIDILHCICLELKSQEMSGSLLNDENIDHDESLQSALIERQFACLGVKDKSLLTIGLDFVRMIGLAPNVFQCLRTTTLIQTGTRHPPLNERVLYFCTKWYCYFVKDSEIGTIIQTRYLQDIFAGLIQLGYSEARRIANACCSHCENTRLNCVNASPCLVPTDSGSVTTCGYCHICVHEQEICKDLLEELLNIVYQPMVVKVLLLLQKGGASGHSNTEYCDQHKQELVLVRKICGKLLSQRIMKKKGVFTFIEALSEGCELEVLPWKKCDMIGKVISTSPQQVDSVEDYYSHICRQILGLLKWSSKKFGRQIIRIVGSCVTNMSQKQPDLARKYVFKPLLHPLYALLSSELDSDVQENELLKTMENMQKLFVHGVNPADNLLQVVGEVMHPIFQLYCFTKDSISILQSLSKDVLLWFLRNNSVDKAIIFLKSACFGNHSCSPARISVNTEIMFEFGNTGGVLIKKLPPSQGTDEEENRAWLSTELRIVCILSLLRELKKDDIISSLFLSLLGDVSASHISSPPCDSKETDLTDVDRTIETLRSNISIVSLLSAIGEDYGPSLIKNKKEIATFVKMVLQQHTFQHSSGETIEEHRCNLALALLAVLLNEDEAPDYNFYQDLLPHLRRVSDDHPSKVVKETAEHLRVGIATRGAVWGTNKEVDSCEIKHEKKDTITDLMSLEQYEEAMNDLKDPLISTRGHALLQLTKLLEVGNPNALENLDNLLSIFRENVVDDDSYMYLAAVRGMATLANRRHEVVIPFLAREFAMFPDKEKGSQNQKTKMYSPELRMKLGECLVKATKNVGDLLPRYSQVLLASLLTGTKDADSFVRASSLVNIGVTCKLLKFSVGGIIHEIFSCVSSIVLTDTENEVRRAAILVIQQLLEGLGKDVWEALQSVLRDLYRLLKRVAMVDPDEVTKNHAESALSQLDKVMRENIFGSSELRKEIKILP